MRDSEWSVTKGKTLAKFVCYFPPTRDGQRGKDITKLYGYDGFLTGHTLCEWFY